MIRSFFLFILFMVLCQGHFPAQNATIDSLAIALKNSVQDSSKVKALNRISHELIGEGEYVKASVYAKKALLIVLKPNLESRKNGSVISGPFLHGEANAYHNIGHIYYNQGSYDSAIEFYSKSLAIREKMNYKLGIASSCTHLGNSYNGKGEFLPAMNFHSRALEVWKAIGNKRGISSSYNNFGMIYQHLGDYDKALDFYLKSLQIDEEIGAKQEIGYTSMNIGNIHSDKGDHDKALVYYLKSFEILEDLGDQQGISSSYINIGNIHYVKGDYENALTCFLKSLAIDEELGNAGGVAFTYSTLGIVYQDKDDKNKALDYFMKGLRIQEELDDQVGIAISYSYLGNFYLEEHKNDLAQQYYLKSLKTAQSLKALPEVMDAYAGLVRVDSALGNFKGAFSYHKLYLQVRDSIHNEESNKKLVQSEMNYEFEKKEQQIKIEQEKKEVIHSAELAQQTTLRNGFFVGFSLMIALTAVSYRSYRNKKKANEIISLQKLEVENQKHLVEEKQKEIIDSITYAKRLQHAILPPLSFWKQNFPESFVLYKPKDIVAGDFYWMEILDNNSILFAAADCTGHGVPGAMVSVVCSNAMNRAVKEFGITEPGKILDKVRTLIIETFEKSESEVKDGMDISLCLLDKNSGKLKWSGANNPLWLIKNGTSEIIDVKADKQPVGKYAAAKEYTTHEFLLDKGDRFYIFTDGYADQFGGEKGKKFMSAKLRNLFLSMNGIRMEEQHLLINDTFDSWKQNHEQVDDVCVIGIEIG
ncbi:MAG: tetratricopeptide repeat protein [Bacteroidota bacterium]|nr:tetratricopeptide repeat protein [Bacteroidota bacterium]